MQVEVYVIGGFVRDKIIGRSTSDADIVCVGNAIELANEVASQYQPRPSVSFFKNFGTAHFKIQDPDGRWRCGICRCTKEAIVQLRAIRILNQEHWKTIRTERLYDQCSRHQSE